MMPNMSNKRNYHNKVRSNEVTQLDEYILHEEIAYTLTKLDLAYLRYSTILDKAIEPVDVITENIEIKKKKSKVK
jgi:hypothetical protein